MVKPSPAKHKWSNRHRLKINRRAAPSRLLAPAARQSAARRTRETARRARARGGGVADAVGGGERELAGFSPRIDRIFPTETSKRYLKG